MKKFFLVTSFFLFCAFSLFRFFPTSVTAPEDTAFPQEDFVPRRIQIQNLSVDLPVRKARIINGFWEVFDHEASWGEQSGEPGKPGNQVIFAHNTQDLFRPLYHIREGELILVSTKSRIYTYQVTSMKQVFPTDVSVVAYTPDETLTLYTCSGPSDSTRFVVTAKRV